MQLHIYKNPDELSEEVAKWIVALIEQSLRSNDRFTIALSGGSTPKILFEKLAAPPYREKISWDRIHIFWGDERFVPFTDDRNNAKMAYDALLSKVDIPASQIHRMRTDLPQEEAVSQYENILHSYFDETGKSFDLVLLGMGEDGHTLSLFPGLAILDNPRKWVNAVFAEEQKMFRITLLPVIVNRAAVVCFVVAGKDKSKTLQQVLKGKYQPEKYPSQLIHPDNELHWFIDEAAASELVKNAG